jgi:hypothetical protein
MSLARSARPALGALVVLVAAACGAAKVAPSPAATATTAASSAAAPTTAEDILDTSSIGTAFDFAMRVPLPHGWLTVLPPSAAPVHTVAVLHGHPGEESTWWGPGFMLVDGATVRDPADGAAANSATAWVPWPASYLDYLAALPGVTIVEAPSTVTIGGVNGRAITVQTPAMAPTIWVKDDYTWLGGGATGMDPAFERRLVELTVHGTSLLIEYDDDPAKFDERIGDVESVLASVEFPT